MDTKTAMILLEAIYSETTRIMVFVFFFFVLNVLINGMMLLAVLLRKSDRKAETVRKPTKERGSE